MGEKSSFSGTESPGEDGTVSSEISWLDQGLIQVFISALELLLWIPAPTMAKRKAKPLMEGCSWLPSPHSSAVPWLFPSQVRTTSVSTH